jgi:methyl-accepting chemotaxis protein
LLKSIRSRFTVFLVLMAVIPLIAMGVVTQYLFKDSMTQEIQEKSTIVCNNLVDNINIFIEQNKSVLSSLALTRAVRDFDKDLEFFLSDVFVQSPQILRITAARTTGEFITVPNATYEEEYDVTNEDWFKSAVHREVFISNVKFDSSFSAPIISLSSPIRSRSSNETIGVLCLDLSLSSFNQTVANMDIGKQGLAFICDQDGEVIAHKEFELVKAKTNMAEHAFVKDALEGNSGFTTYKDESGVDQFVAYSRHKTTGWGIFVQQPVSETFAHVNQVTNTTMAIVGIMLILSIILGSFVGKAITKPITRLVEHTNSVSKGNLAEINQIKGFAEIEALSSSFNKMVSSLKTIVNEVIQSAETLSASAQELASGAEQTNQATQQVAGAIQQIAAGANEQAKKLSEISEIIGELESSNDTVDHNAKSAVNLTSEMSKNADNSRSSINSATEKMDSIKSTVDRLSGNIKGLDVSIQKIGVMVDLIMEIVDQTNLLSLNASIEAARAGEHGRGFAVVADEVRKLAEQSGETAKQISDLVRQIQQNSKNAVDAMAESLKEVDEGRNYMGDVNNKMVALQKLVDYVTSSAKDISSEITSQNEKMDHVVDMVNNISSISQETAAGTQQVSASAEEQTATMENIEASARELAKLSENLTMLVSKFNSN